MNKLLFIIVLFFSLNVLADEYMIIKSFHDHNIIHMKFDLKDQQNWTKQEFKTLEICNQYLTKNYEKKQFGKLATHPNKLHNVMTKLPENFRKIIPEYIKDHVNLNRFMV